MPRSGTTVIFELLATHPELGWFSNYCDLFPNWPQIAVLSRCCNWSPAFRKAVRTSDQAHSWWERYRIGPAEAYRVWESLCGEKFRYQYLRDVEATPTERSRARRAVFQVLRWQGKRRFAAKITGPPRIGFLSSVFPDAHFVHIVRDCRAVVHSVLHVDFWERMDGRNRPVWEEGFPEPYRERWEALNRSPLALAALQWRAVIEAVEHEKAALPPHQFHELRYEDFLAAPRQRLAEVCRGTGLDPAPEIFAFLEQRFELRNRNEAFRSQFSSDEIDLIEELAGEPLRRLGYPLP